MLFTLKREQRRATEVLARIDALPRAHAGLYVWQTALTLARLDAGDTAGARERYECEAKAGFPVPRDVFWLATNALLAETCVALGDAARAPQLYERLLPHADRLVQVSFAVCWGPVERYLGLLAALIEDVDAAMVHAEAALRSSEAMDAPLLAARSRFELGRALLARGQPDDRERAEESIRAALEAATALGAEQLASSCNALLAEVSL
jgi:tetratricopeptide (TPR) repeat protein